MAHVTEYFLSARVAWISVGSYLEHRVGIYTTDFWNVSADGGFAVYFIGDC
ncbi:hypothetical protein [Listeria rocourtiae]|uniref:hypothetical protein n=1 Tax=Listeria rocourtiae TaxID=647910 RepID=UPI00131EFF90|nr:hypothetical protein [Listeria rocourtiae]